MHPGGTNLKTFFCSLLAWLCTIACFLQAMALPKPYTFVVIGATFAVLANAFPFITVSGFRAHNVGWAFGFGLFGMDWDTAMVSGFAVNVLTTLTSIIFSVGILMYLWARKDRVREAKLEKGTGA